jgi:amyloid beta precursor protein binding protein 1
LSPIVASLASTLPSSSSSSPSSDYAPLPDNVYAIQSDAREDLLATTMDPHETDPAQTPVLWWIALRACDAFYDRHGHYPGKHDQELAWEADANEVYGCMVRIAGGMGLAESDLVKEHLLDPVRGKDLAREVVRYDEAEIHNVAAVVGGVASQEAVKLITGQYVPIDDTYIYNGIASTAGVYRF